MCLLNSNFGRQWLATFVGLGLISLPTWAAVIADGPLISMGKWTHQPLLSEDPHAIHDSIGTLLPYQILPTQGEIDFNRRDSKVRETAIKLFLGESFIIPVILGPPPPDDLRFAGLKFVAYAPDGNHRVGAFNKIVFDALGEWGLRNVVVDSNGDPANKVFVRVVADKSSLKYDAFANWMESTHHSYLIVFVEGDNDSVEVRRLSFQQLPHTYPEMSHSGIRAIVNALIKTKVISKDKAHHSQNRLSELLARNVRFHWSAIAYGAPPEKFAADLELAKTWVLANREEVAHAMKATCGQEILPTGEE